MNVVSPPIASSPPTSATNSKGVEFRLGDMVNAEDGGVLVFEPAGREILRFFDGGLGLRAVLQSDDGGPPFPIPTVEQIVHVSPPEKPKPINPEWANAVISARRIIARALEMDPDPDPLAERARMVRVIWLQFRELVAVATRLGLNYPSVPNVLLANLKDDDDIRELVSEEDLEALFGEAEAYEPEPEPDPQPDPVLQGSSWDEPIPLPASKPKVEPFSPLFLPEALRPWIEDISDRLQCPPEYPAICAMTGIGSLLAAKVVIRPQAFTDWEEASNVWGLLIGRPGMLKSPAARAALAPLKRLEARAVDQNKADLLAYKQQSKLYKLKETVAEQKFKEEFRKNPLAVQMDIGEEPEEPQPRRHMTNDTTYEKLGEIQIVNTSILVMRDELVSLLMYLDREENSQARGYFMTGWSGLDGHIFDRIVRGHKGLDRYAIGMLGTTQPGRIAEYIKRAHAGGAGDDGFVQRLTQGVWPDEPLTWTDRDVVPNTKALNAAWEVFKRIADATPTALGATEEEGRIPYLRFDKAGLGDFQDWHKGLNTKMKSGDLAPAFESHLAKYKTQVAAYALISHICDVKEGGPVNQTAARRSIAFCDYLETHARRIYGAVIMAEVLAAKEILKHIRKRDLSDGFTSRDVHRPRWTGLTDIETVREGLRMLVDHRYLRVEKVQTDGRDRVAYQINPAAFQ
jgi:putative DNA primase/helicase